MDADQQDFERILAAHAESVQSAVRNEMDSKFSSLEAKFTEGTHTLLKA